MTAEDFRQLALSFPDTEERSHMSHPDFRAHGKIFATLGYPNAEWGMVKLTPEQQHNYCCAYPEMFEPVNGAWGKGGATRVRLAAAKTKLAAGALADAYANVPAGKSPGARRPPKRVPRSR